MFYSKASSFFYVTIGSVMLALTLFYMFLFWIRRQAHPIAPRNPTFAIFTATISICVLSFFCLDRYFYVPCATEMWGTFPVQNVALACNLARIWKFFFKSQVTAQALLSAGDMKENFHRTPDHVATVKNPAWFLTNQWMAGYPFITAVLLFIFGVNSAVPIMLSKYHHDSNVYPRPASEGDCGPQRIYIFLGYLILAEILIFMAAFISFAFTLRTLRENLHLKNELAGQGQVGVVAVLCWFIVKLVPGTDKGQTNFPLSTLFYTIGGSIIIFISLAYPLHMSTYFYNTAPRSDYVSFDTPTMNNIIYCSTYLCGGRPCKRRKNRWRALDASARDIGSHQHAEGGTSSKTDPIEPESIKIQEFLQHPEGMEAFRDFLKQELSVENLLFVEAVDNYFTIPVANEEQRKNATDIIYKSFLAKDAPLQVNLPFSLSNKLDHVLGPIKIPKSNPELKAAVSRSKSKSTHKPAAAANNNHNDDRDRDMESSNNSHLPLPSSPPNFRNQFSNSAGSKRRKGGDGDDGEEGEKKPKGIFRLLTAPDGEKPKGGVLRLLTAPGPSMRRSKSVEVVEVDDHDDNIVSINNNSSSMNNNNNNNNNNDVGGSSSTTTITTSTSIINEENKNNDNNNDDNLIINTINTTTTNQEQGGGGGGGGGGEVAMAIISTRPSSNTAVVGARPSSHTTTHHLRPSDNQPRDGTVVDGLLSDAKNEIVKLMERDPYTRFKRTKPFKTVSIDIRRLRTEM